MRSIIAVVLLVASLAGEPVQAQASGSPDSSVKSPLASLPANAIVVRDTGSWMTPREAFRRPVPVPPTPAPEERSGICGNIKQWKCIAYGALLGFVGGAWVGDAFAAQPEYRDSGGILSSQICVSNCGTPKVAVYLAFGGSVLGGLGGWLLSR